MFVPHRLGWFVRMLFAARFLIACCVVAWYFMLLTFLPLYCVWVLKISTTDTGTPYPIGSDANA